MDWLLSGIPWSHGLQWYENGIENFSKKFQKYETFQSTESIGNMPG